ncbi:serine/arginine repetitive matrix protein 5-like [Palaemon carinicauda]|uniref:serine/arginine repetitive matrix protein 5-like n=1 Tax=Palaemon carinicauda TaxID=392227 RepID=UPI0035B5715B
MRTCPGLPDCPCGTFMSTVETDPHTLCPYCRGQRCESDNKCGRPFKGHVDLPPDRPADLPSPFMRADARYAPTKPDLHARQASNPVTGHQGRMRHRVHTSLTRHVVHACQRSPARHALPEVARQRSPARQRTTARHQPPAHHQPPARQRSPTRQGSPTHQRSPTRQCSLAHQRSPARHSPRIVISPACQRSSDRGAIGKSKTSPTRKRSPTRQLLSPARQRSPSRVHVQSPSHARPARPVSPQPFSPTVARHHTDAHPQNVRPHAQATTARPRARGISPARARPTTSTGLRETSPAWSMTWTCANIHPRARAQSVACAPFCVPTVSRVRSYMPSLSLAPSSLAVSTPLKRKRGVPDAVTSPRAKLTPRRPSRQDPSPTPPQTFSPSLFDKDFPSSGESREVRRSPTATMRETPPRVEKSSRVGAEKNLPPSILESYILPRKESKDSKTRSPIERAKTQPWTAYLALKNVLMPVRLCHGLKG